jgi:elongation factor P
MNQQSGEQVSVSREAVGDGAQWLMDGIDCQIVIYQGNPVSVALPAHVIVQVLETEPGARGDTATNVLKPAKVSTGATVGVPLFISEGEWIRVDTREGKYNERVKAPTG